SIELTDEFRDVAVIRAEVMSPLAHAMCLVHDPEGGGSLTQQDADAYRAQLFGADVEQPLSSGSELVDAKLTFGGCQGAIDECGEGETRSVEIRNLVLHKCLQRRDDHGKTALFLPKHQCW